MESTHIPNISKLMIVLVKCLEPNVCKWCSYSNSGGLECELQLDDLGPFI